MDRRNWRTNVILTALLILFVAQVSRAEPLAAPPLVRNLTQIQFEPTPGFPKCAVSAVQNGDPRSGPSILLGKLESDCIVPWHWHTPNEHLMMVRGLAEVEMKDGTKQTLREGGFALMPSRHVHQFRCMDTCILFVYSDAPLDIHYVDGDRRDISATEAPRHVGTKDSKSRP